MSQLEELQMRKKYYKAKYLYIKMKINKLIKDAPTEYIKTIVNDTITITEETDEEPEEPVTDVSLFFQDNILKDDKAKIKRSDCYNRYIKYCESKQLKPKIKSIFFEDIEAFLGKPIKSNVYCYKNYRFVESDTPLTFNQSIEDLIF